MKLLILLLLVLNVNAQPSLTVLGDSFPPFSYRANGKSHGMVYEMVESIIKDSKVEVKRNIISSWKHVLEHTKANPNTLLYTIVRTPERENQFEWIGAISDRRMYFYALKSRKDISIDSWKDIPKYQTLSLEKATITKYVRERGAQIYPSTDLKQAYHMLLKGRADLVVMLDYSLNHLDKKKLTKPLFKIDQPGEFYIAMNKDSSPELVKKIRNSFHKLMKNGVIEKIKLKHSPK